MTLWIFF